MNKAKWKQYTQSELFRIAQNSINRTDFLIRLGYKKYDKKTFYNILVIYPEISEILPTKKDTLQTKWRNFSKEEIINIANNSHSRIEFMSQLGYTTSRLDVYNDIVKQYPEIHIQKHTESLWENFSFKELEVFAATSTNETDFCKKIGYKERNNHAIKKIREKYPSLKIPKSDNQCKWNKFSENELQTIANQSDGFQKFYQNLGYSANSGLGKIKEDIQKSFPNFIFPSHAKMSLGEQKIKEVLNSLLYKYQEQIYFKDLKGKNSYLKFDFGIFINEKIILIEYQGEQHYEEIKIFKDTLKERQERDNKKREYCKEHNIPLIEIPYWDYDKINEEYIKERLDEYCN